MQQAMQARGDAGGFNLEALEAIFSLPLLLQRHRETLFALGSRLRVLPLPPLITTLHHSRIISNYVHRRRRRIRRHPPKCAPSYPCRCSRCCPPTLELLLLRNLAVVVVARK